jgi:D-glycerate 3-kinase
VIGLCGAQGSGKSTLAAAMQRALIAGGARAAVLSIDDLYLTRAERVALAHEVHPLLATRGVPGTHDIGLGLALFAALDNGQRVRLPRFDKAADDRAPESDWPIIDQPLDVLIFEGWCVGARPQADAALAQPVNTLEATEDRKGIWRRYANAALAGRYRQLFARIERLILLAAPSFTVVRRWRGEQEAALRAERPDGAALQDAAALDRFIQHYERLTRHILDDMPGYADLVLRLDDVRKVLHD